MLRSRALLLVALGAVILVGACSSGGGGSDLLASIKSKGEVRVNTDPNYAPQSFAKSDGTLDGFDIDVSKEIARRLGVKVAFTTLDFAIAEAGKWAGRFDISVGSMTITEKRKGVLDFSPPYYYTPAQIAATTASGITALDGLAGKRICMGEGTTYFQWLTGTLVLGDGGKLAPVPTGATAVTLKTDQDCAQSVKSGRTDFEAWLSSSTTVADAIKAGTPMIPIGDPVFYEPLAVAADKSGPSPTSLMVELNKIVAEMHKDGTLKTLSMKWFGVDLTTVK